MRTVARAVWTRHRSVISRRGGVCGAEVGPRHDDLSTGEATIATGIAGRIGLPSRREHGVVNVNATIQYGDLDPRPRAVFPTDQAPHGLGVDGGEASVQ